MDVMQDNNLENTDANLVEIPVLQQDVSETKPVKLAFPEEDYDRNGKLKRVRGRMLKKLLKYEWKGLIPVFLLLGTALVSSVITALFFRFLGEDASDFSVMCGVLSMLLFIFSSMGALIASWVVPVQRYDNNFFKAEGYLTFSIPASMEEQLLAKRITALVSILVVNVGVFLAIILFASISGAMGFFEVFKGIFVAISAIYGGEILPTILFIFEIVLLWLVSVSLAPCFLGALCCSVHKYEKKKKNRRATLGIMGAMYGSSMLISILGISGFLDFLASVFNGEVLMLIWILVIVGIEALCMWYEMRTLKKNLNLR